MKVVFRCDASLQIGTGHVMRCLTLADALKAQGAQCHFIGREHPGHLLEFIRQRGYSSTVLPAGMADFQLGVDISQPLLAHAAWLGCDWLTDAEQCRNPLAQIQPDWLVVDHYALDARWQAALAVHHHKLMVIDDLADRPHLSDLLLDQTFGRNPEAYNAWVPSRCKLLCGSQYALLRPEFAALREYSLARRGNPSLRHLLITMGGVDKDNATSQVLDTLKGGALPVDCRITVVMGSTAPWLASVQQKAAELPWPTEVKVSVSDMARLMADSDLAIGAAGSTSWERCCLGLPTLMVVLEENQQTLTRTLEQAEAVCVLSDLQQHLLDVLARFVVMPSMLADMTQKASGISDGCGVAAVIHAMEL